MFGYAVEVVKRSQQQSFQVSPKRWIVEHTFAWLNWSRRLSKDYELNRSSAETPSPTDSCAASLRFQTDS
jgi:putative transposase